MPNNYLPGSPQFNLLQNYNRALNQIYGHTLPRNRVSTPSSPQYNQPSRSVSTAQQAIGISNAMGRAAVAGDRAAYRAGAAASAALGRQQVADFYDANPGMRPMGYR